MLEIFFIFLKIFCMCGHTFSNEYEKNSEMAVKENM